MTLLLTLALCVSPGISSDIHGELDYCLNLLEEGNPTGALYVLSFAAATWRTEILAEEQGWRARERWAYQADLWIAFTLMTMGWGQEAEPWIRAARDRIDLSGGVR